MARDGEVIQMQHFCHHGDTVCHPKSGYVNGVARIFVWGGHPADATPATFSVIFGSRPDSVGGVVAEIFRVPHEPDSLGGGGGSS